MVCIYKEYYSKMKKNEILPFVTMWMELEGIILSAISQRKTDIRCFHSYVEVEKLKGRAWGRGRGKKLHRGMEANHKRLLNTENKLRIDGEWGRGENG